MKFKKYLFPFIFFIILFYNFISSEIIEELYAVVNGEMITYSELTNLEKAITFQLSRNYKGEELKKAILEMKKNLLKTLIEQKLILSKAREKDYDLEKDIEIMIGEIKKQNNFSNDKQLKEALLTQGITFEEFKEQQKLFRMKQKLISEEIGSKLSADNSEIMEYYKKNIKQYTKPQKISLNCIFLSKESYLDKTFILEKMKKIDSELTKNNFKKIGEKYSELPNSENKIYLGEYKEGELDQKIEKVALKLKKGEHSSWIETENGWYLIQLLKITEPELIKYKEVRDKIRIILLEKKQKIELEKYIEELRKESHIKIYKEYK